MGEIIGGLVEGLFTGIKGVIDRNRLATDLEHLAAKVRRGDVVSDEALAKANKTLQRMRSARADFQE